jgi:thymidylate synthase
MSIRICEEFGTHVYGPTIGVVWANLVKVVLDANQKSHDEDRERIAVSNVRVKSMMQNFPDATIESLCDAEQLKDMLGFMFEYERMRDIDVVQSFSPGAKSYCYRIKEGRMVEFVIERLSLIPESKKAVIVFPTYEDYAAVMENHKDDYLPCLVSIQFRLLPKGNGYAMHTTFYSRSMDVWQKGHGNLLAIAMLSDHVAKEIGKRIGKTIELGPLDGLICDAHIYGEKYDEANTRISSWVASFCRDSNAEHGI